MTFCTQCGQEGSGRFCSSCGASLEAVPCRACGEELPVGTRFCTACGSPVGAGTQAESAGGPAGGRTGAATSAVGMSGNSAKMGWWVSGILLAAVVLVVAFVEFSGGADEPTATVAGAPQGGGLGPAPNVDLSSMTPREAADNLFNRVMQSVAAGNTTEATNFLPMAIAAYDMARPLNADGLFHLSLLQRAGQEHEGALQSAVAGLTENPDHLLNLYAAAEASIALGDSTAARGYYERLVAAWDREVATDRLEYEEHAPLLPLIQEDADAVLSEGGES